MAVERDQPTRLVRVPFRGAGFAPGDSRMGGAAALIGLVALIAVLLSGA